MYGIFYPAAPPPPSGPLRKSLLRTLRLRAIRLIIIVIDPRTSRVPASKLLHGSIGVVVRLVDLVSDDAGRGAGEDGAELIQAGGVGEEAVGGEGDVDGEVEVAFGVAALVRHAFAGDAEDLAGSEDLARLLGVVEFEAAAVEVFEDDALEAGEGFGEGEGEFGGEVGGGAVEGRVGELLQVED